MRNLKKILALVLAMVMVLSMMVTASAVDFNDATEIDSKYTEAVKVMAALGVLSGKEQADGSFNIDPKGTLRRDEAAVIIAKVLEGSVDAVKDLADSVESPFVDVAKWAKPYVDAAYAHGVISGNGGTKYYPAQTLTGHQFGKMLLIAIGNNTAADFDGKADWKVTVATQLQKTGILSGVTVTLSKPLTREQASQLAWNAMHWSPAGESEEYTVWVDDGDDVIEAGENILYKGSDALIASLIKGQNVSNELKRVVKYNNSLADNVFGLVANQSTDAFGRVTTVYTAALLPTMKVTLATDAAPIKFASKADYTVTTDTQILAAINAELKLQGLDQLVDADIYAGGGNAEVTPGSIAQHLNGVTGFANIEKGDSVEVYVNNLGYVYKVIVVREQVAPATLGTEITTGLYKGLYTWTFGTATTIAPKTAYVKDAYYVVIENGTTNVALSIEAPVNVVTGKIAKADNQTVASGDYLISGGNKLYFAGNYVVDDADDTMDYTTKYDIICNSNGYILYVVTAGAAPAAQKETGYAYLQRAETQIYTTGLDSLINGAIDYSWNIIAKAELALPDGTSKVVDLYVEKTTNSYGYVTAAKVGGHSLTGVAGDLYADNLMDNTDENLFYQWGWVKYTVEADGTYTLANVTGLNGYGNHVLTKGDAEVVSGTKYATSTTPWAYYEYSTITKKASVVSGVGYNSFLENVYAGTNTTYTTSSTDASVVTAIDTFKVVVPTSTANYAYYVGQGDYVGGSTNDYAHRFYINGEIKEYFLNGVTVGSAAANVIEVGKVFDLSFTSGKITGATPVAYTQTGKEVVRIDETYIMVDGSTTPVYLAEGYVVYNIDDGEGAADTLSTKITDGGDGDIISYIEVDGKVVVAYITTNAD